MRILDKEEIPSEKWCPGTPDHFHVWLDITPIGDKLVYLCRYCNRRFKAPRHTIEHPYIDNPNPQKL